MEKQILFCKCNDEIAQEYELNKIKEVLDLKGIPFILLDDLCGLVAKNKELVEEKIIEDKETLLISCYSRTNKLLLKLSGVDLNKTKIQYINHREKKIDEIEEIFEDFIENDFMSKDLNISKLESDKDWPSWFPIIDYERCTNCGQCADFCLFGVYEKQEGSVTVVNPHNCKNLCPACARICPQMAIIFPKFKEGGAISGNDNFDEEVEKARLANDIEAITGGDIYKTLEMRKRKRKSIIKKEEIEKAKAERDDALNKLRNNQ